jgi:hypothetical protein
LNATILFEARPAPIYLGGKFKPVKSIHPGPYRISFRRNLNLLMPPETCPHCGAELPRRARACPECGSDEQTGWSDDARREDLGLPAEGFDYDDFVQREFAGGKPVPRGLRWYWWLVAFLLLAAILWTFLR